MYRRTKIRIICTGFGGCPYRGEGEDQVLELIESNVKSMY